MSASTTVAGGGTSVWGIANGRTWFHAPPAFAKRNVADAQPSRKSGSAPPAALKALALVPSVRMAGMRLHSGPAPPACSAQPQNPTAS